MSYAFIPYDRLISVTFFPYLKFCTFKCQWFELPNNDTVSRAVETRNWKWENIFITKKKIKCTKWHDIFDISYNWQHNISTNGKTLHSQRKKPKKKKHPSHGLGLLRSNIGLSQNKCFKRENKIDSHERASCVFNMGSCYCNKCYLHVM